MAVIVVGTSPDSDRPDLAPGVNYFVRSRTGDQWEVDVVDAPATAEIAAARAALLAATTVAQTKARTVALFDLLNTNPGETP